MKNIKYSFICCILLPILMVSKSLNAQIVGNFGNDAILHNVNVVDVEKGKVLYNMDVIIENGLFKRVKKSASLGEGMIDLSGKYIMPGLIDAHAHWSDCADTEENLKLLAEAFYDYGITTVRDCGGDIDVIKSYNNKVLKGEIRGPFVYYSSLWAGDKHCKVMERLCSKITHWDQRITDDNNDFESMIITAKNAGCTGLKLYADIKQTDIVRIVKLCKKHDVKVWGHFSLGPEYAYEAVKAGIEVLSHSYLLDYDIAIKNNSLAYDSPQPVLTDGIFDYNQLRSKTFALMKKNNQIFDPTIYLCIANGMPQSADYLKDAYKSGVKIVAGTDYMVIKHLPNNNKYKTFLLDELYTYVDKCGFSVLDAIKSATIIGAEALGKKDELGVIKKGAKADYLVLDSNPLESLDAIKESIDKYLQKKAELLYDEYKETVGKYFDKVNVMAKDYFSATDVNIKDSLSNVMDAISDKAFDTLIEGIGMLYDTELCLKFFYENIFLISSDYSRFKKAVEIIDDGFPNNPLKAEIMKVFMEEKGKQLEGKAPDFSLNDIDGNIVSLSDFKGKYVLLDFWASWCAPCRKKNRELNCHYEDLKAKNLNIISISLDEDSQKWKNAIKQDGIKWLMLNDSKGIKQSDVAKAYKVYSIPTVYLINPQGYVIAKNPSVEKILEIMAKINSKNKTYI